MTDPVQASQAIKPENAPLDLSHFTYSRTLLAAETAANQGTLGDMPGYTEFKNWPALGYDLMNGAFVEGAADIVKLEEKLIARFGDDYSLRYIMLELSKGESRADAQNAD